MPRYNSLCGSKSEFPLNLGELRVLGQLLVHAAGGCRYFGRVSAADIGHEGRGASVGTATYERGDVDVGVGNAVEADEDGWWFVEQRRGQL